MFSEQMLRVRAYGKTSRATMLPQQCFLACEALYADITCALLRRLEIDLTGDLKSHLKLPQKSIKYHHLMKT